MARRGLEFPDGYKNKKSNEGREVPGLQVKGWIWEKQDTFRRMKGREARRLFLLNRRAFKTHAFLALFLLFAQAAKREPEEGWLLVVGCDGVVLEGGTYLARCSSSNSR